MTRNEAIAIVFEKAGRSVVESDSIHEQQVQSVAAIAEQAVEYLMELDELKKRSVSNPS